MGEKVFVKVDTRDGFLSNEKFAYSFLNSAEYLVPLRLFLIEGERQYAVFKFIDSHKLDLDFVQRNPEIADAMFAILVSINGAGLIHRDIKLDNFVFDDRLYLIDFSYCESFKSDVDLKRLNISLVEDRLTLRALSNSFKLDDFSWDDFYSLDLILSEILEQCHEEEMFGSFEHIRQNIASYRRSNRTIFKIPEELL